MIFFSTANETFWNRWPPFLFLPTRQLAIIPAVELDHRRWTQVLEVFHASTNTTSTIWTRHIIIDALVETDERLSRPLLSPPVIESYGVQQGRLGPRVLSACRTEYALLIICTYDQADLALPVNHGQPTGLRLPCPQLTFKWCCFSLHFAIFELMV
ncbi:uncharacterized protein BO72DRAFT_36249 [Aspergillus fijiensis CBS 313.89]|uniref:Uncharacterized protein n=1 Tax=Aspergillus fijiensis CBS 313.89 TaxID=1448319 RepID=A0A8G1W1J9_9EURO|nr:uncharacterized protein BO72DRAFT_36249 [Aspergillus fijiensis CBS 313.89]RAK79773.1 hypothetical protein BO72DRAFT_36249 [Aspergillus fijiensis CBS 313.89]